MVPFWGVERGRVKWAWLEGGEDDLLIPRDSLSCFIIPDGGGTCITNNISNYASWEKRLKHKTQMTNAF